jgi:Flp pilus assembly protein TadG
MTMQRRNRERGAAAVEFALVLPILLTLTLGAIDFGWFFYIDQLVTNAAREGARAGTLVAPTAAAATAENAAQTAAESYLTKVSLSATGVEASLDTSVAGTQGIKVVISYPVGSLTGFFSTVMPANAVGRAVMRWK